MMLAEHQRGEPEHQLWLACEQLTGLNILKMIFEDWGRMEWNG